MVKTKTNLIVGILLAFFIIFNICTKEVEANDNEYKLGPGSTAKITFDYDPGYYVVTRVYVKGGSSDFVRYLSNGNFSALRQFSGDFWFDISRNQEVILTNTSSSTTTINAPSKRVEISGTATPALKKERLEPGKSMTLKNSSLGSASFKVGGVYDYANYDKTGNIKNFRLDSSLTSHNVYSSESVAITNSSTKVYEVIAPYKPFTLLTRSMNRLHLVGQIC